MEQRNIESKEMESLDIYLLNEDYYIFNEEEEDNKEYIKKIKQDILSYGKITSLQDINKYLDIEKNVIKVKKRARVFIDKSEYKEDQITETSEYYLVPGILEVYFPDDQKLIQLPFTFNVKLYKTDNIIETPKEILIEYQPGDILIKQEYKSKEISFKTFSRILEGSAKFLKTPEQYVLLLIEQLNYSIDLVHIESLVQHLFRCADDYQKPCRLCDYKDCEVLGISKIPKYTSWLLALEFERVKSVLKHVLINKTPLKGTAFEKIFLEY